jgi:hypothetical protein
VAKSKPGNINKNDSVMLKASDRTAAAKRNKLHKTDNESVNIPILKFF